ncbi:hypothetical protein [Paracidobacterium acidisoli]|uniref:Uncharacterized protein n=1 Tax=Paracidobacterium acidisoli TaxID=2303751 RepID=A0A372IPE3_9BACT|nr:hypothetical protein [Paracidobacterium acidisoli]MBT9331059.1 hypothetical protein [Paracidobacterium acidisoli]
MGETALVEVDFRRSAQIVGTLEEKGIHVALAVWAHFPEYEDWRFVVASKELDPLSLAEGYGKVTSALHEAGIDAWQTPLIFLMKTSDPFVRALRKVFGKTDSVFGMRLGGQTWGNRFVDDAYAYKIA